MNIKKNDTVLVITGKDKGTKGKILEVSPKSEKVVVEGVNVLAKHKKPRSAQDKGGIIKSEHAIDASNVMIICPACGKATRVAHKVIDGKNVRICKKCGAGLDKEAIKVVKKETKKASTKKAATTAEVKED